MRSLYHSSSSVGIAEVSIDCNLLRPFLATTNPTCFVYRRMILDTGPGDEIFKTSTAKKTAMPRWNEAFQINVYDAEARHLFRPFIASDLIIFVFRFVVRNHLHPNLQR